MGNGRHPAKHSNYGPSRIQALDLTEKYQAFLGG